MSFNSPSSCSSARYALQDQLPTGWYQLLQAQPTGQWHGSLITRGYDHGMCIVQVASKSLEVYTGGNNHGSSPVGGRLPFLFNDHHSPQNECLLQNEIVLNSALYWLTDLLVFNHFRLTVHFLSPPKQNWVDLFELSTTTCWHIAVRAFS